jgi:Uma2 family endonuclease
MGSLAPAKSPFTYEDYCLLPEDGKRYFYLSPSPSTIHQVVSRRLQFELMVQLERTKVAQIFNAPMDVILEPTTVVQPDLIIVSRAREHIISPRAIEGAPDVLVEILSPSSLDRDSYIKRKLYERCGVREYWIVDPDHGSLEVWRNEDQHFGIRARYDRASTLVSPDFEQLSVPLYPVFEQG